MATRTVLVHLNVEVPDDAPATAADIAAEVKTCLDFVTDNGDDEWTPALNLRTYTVALAEEV